MYGGWGTYPLKSGLSSKHIAFIRAIEGSRHFGQIVFKSYSEMPYHKKSIQFAAADFAYKDQWNFIAFRGTDDTIAGWKEDFMIAFTRTPAQEKALEFAQSHIYPGTGPDEACTRTGLPAIKPYILAPVSAAFSDSTYWNLLSRLTLRCACNKGTGPLAGQSPYPKYCCIRLSNSRCASSSAFYTIDLQEYVDCVYDLDGPGFCGEVFDLTALDRIREKTTFIILEFSVIGRLFEPDFPDTKIVVSDESAVMQHELLLLGSKIRRTGYGIRE